MKLDPTVHIFARNGIAKVFIDGAEIPCVTRVEFIQESKDFPCVKLSIAPDQVTLGSDHMPNIITSEE